MAMCFAISWILVILAITLLERDYGSTNVQSQARHIFPNKVANVKGMFSSSVLVAYHH
jgi:hypothetical protein